MYEIKEICEWNEIDEEKTEEVLSGTMECIKEIGRQLTLIGTELRSRGEIS